MMNANHFLNVRVPTVDITIPAFLFCLSATCLLWCSLMTAYLFCRYVHECLMISCLPPAWVSVLKPLRAAWWLKCKPILTWNLYSWVCYSQDTSGPVAMDGSCLQYTDLSPQEPFCVLVGCVWWLELIHVICFTGIIMLRGGGTRRALVTTCIQVR